MIKSNLFNTTSNAIINSVNELIENGLEVEAAETISKCLELIKEKKISVDGVTSTAYINSINIDKQYSYPGDVCP